MRLKYGVILLLIVVSLIYNFKMPKQVIDQIYMVTVAGYDYVDENTIQGTVVAPNFLIQGQLVDLVFTDTAAMVYENRSKLNRQASEELLNGKLEVVLFNKELASKGISEFIDYLLRDPSIGSQLHLAIVDGSTYDMLNSIKSNKGAGVYLSDLIEHNSKNGNLPIINLKQFSGEVASKVADPYLPVFKMVDGIPQINGLAIFDKDKYVTTIPSKDVMLFKMLHENMQDGQYFLETKKYNAAIQNIDSTRKVGVTKKNGLLKVNITLKINAVVREFTGKGGVRKKDQIIKRFAKDISSKSVELIKGFQEENVDPLAIEEIVKSRFRDYNSKKFKEAYPTLQIDVDTKFTIAEFGTRR
ncbi:Ger(x)C family spore germination protein [Virgibacillus siamensis]|uniref:Ger(x)C family spore germination protein n=1 Tax=Virgibacillus siamensis TaxID=480071 RepID=UPI0009870D4E|nr:Ger(x)C family spore germination protein [Virgibacillus siamensis]